MFNDFYRGKRVLVTGHTGFKGSWLCEWLLSLGAQVAGFSDRLVSEPSHFETLQLDGRIKHQLGDVRDLSAVEKSFAAFEPEVVFHLAAQALVRAAYVDPKATFDINVGGTVNLLEAVRKAPYVKTAVFITSDKCYENVEWEYGYRETDRLGGKDPYSASKAAAEAAIYSYYQSYFQEMNSPAIASTRAGNVIGGGDWAVDRIIPDCVRAWSQSHSAVLRNPTATRPWQHVLEPLSGYLTLGARLADSGSRLRGQAFNFGPSADASHSVQALVEEMRNHWASSQWKQDEAASPAAHEARLLKLSCDKALDALNWTPTLNFQETVAFTGEWYRDYYSKGSLVTRQQIDRYCELATLRKKAWI